MELKGSRIILREKRLEDAGDDYRWRSDPELVRLDAALPMITDFDEFLQSFKDQLRHPTPWSHHLSIDAIDGAYIGNCMYYDIDTINKEAEIGIMIGNRDYWSHGYGYDVLVTLIDHIFSATSLERLYLHTLDWNLRAQRCFEKCGFVKVRPARRSGQDFFLMDLTKERWLKMGESKLVARAYYRTEPAQYGAATKPPQPRNA